MAHPTQQRPSPQANLSRVQLSKYLYHLWTHTEGFYGPEKAPLRYQGWLTFFHTSLLLESFLSVIYSFHTQSSPPLFTPKQKGTGRGNLITSFHELQQYLLLLSTTQDLLSSKPQLPSLFTKVSTLS